MSAVRPDEEPRIEVGRPHHGRSLFDCLDAELGPLDRRAVRRAAEAGELLLNGEPAGPGVTLRLGDLIELRCAPAPLQRRTAPAVALLHREGSFVVAAKPSGLPFDTSRHGGASALGALQELCGAGRPRPLHRLDRETSGVVVAALDRETAEAVGAEFDEDRAWVEYLAIVRGPLPETSGTVDLPLGKGLRSAVTLRPEPDHGRPARTDWSLVEAFEGFSVLTLRPRGGGRSHQVRAHLVALGNPALCDRDYHEDDRLLLSQLKLHYRPKRGRPERALLERPALHAGAFVRGAQRIVAELPEDLEVVLAQLRRLRGKD